MNCSRSILGTNAGSQGSVSLNSDHVRDNLPTPTPFRSVPPSPLLKTKLDAANLPTPKRRSSSRRSFKSSSPSPTPALPDGEAPGRPRSRLRRQESLPSPSFPPLPSHQSLCSRLSSGLCYRLKSEISLPVMKELVPHYLQDSGKVCLQ
nr:hypothetical protein VITISV_035473 [Ipomoea trifida]